MVDDMGGDPAAELVRAAEAAAAETGRAMVAEARRVRRRMLEDAEARRLALIAELERVRAMLDEAIAALAAEERPAEGQVRDVEPATPRRRDSDGPGAGPSEATGERPDGAEVGVLFARLRSESPPPASAETAAEAEGETAPKVPPEAERDLGADVEDPDAVVRRRRTALLDPLVSDVVRASKRLLQDEQNTLLDAIRRTRGRPEPARLLPDPAHQREAWSALLGPGADAAYLGGRSAVGRTGRVTSAPARVVAELVGVIVNPLRERLGATIDGVVAEGPYESPAELQRAVGAAIGARYREWKAADLETRVVDVLCAAYARGSFDGVGPATPLRWVPDHPGRCPDCDDNALEPTAKGGTFPTGQTHPPAHPGCRCLVVPADAG